MGGGAGVNVCSVLPAIHGTILIVKQSGSFLSQCIRMHSLLLYMNHILHNPIK
jgi:hypothetical protein